MKLFQFALLLSIALTFFTASMPVKKDAPPELTATIEKKWPGSNAVLVTGKTQIDNNTTLYKIVQNSDVLGWAYTSRVLSCRNGGCEGQGSTAEVDISHEYFDYYALLNTQYGILEVKVYNYASTHGQEICSKAWLKQFKGYDGSKRLRYGKDIDAISGATVSGMALTEDIGASVTGLRK
jgi:hypothetical protein